MCQLPADSYSGTSILINKEIFYLKLNPRCDDVTAIVWHINVCVAGQLITGRNEDGDVPLLTRNFSSEFFGNIS